MTNTTQGPITREELAKLLDGRKDEQIVGKDERTQAKLSQLVILYYSGYTMIESDGAIQEELEVEDSGLILTATDLYDANDLVNAQEAAEEHTPFLYVGRQFEDDEQSKRIEIKFDDSGAKPRCYFETDIPHSEFNIIGADENVSCTGIVIDLKEVFDV